MGDGDIADVVGRNVQCAERLDRLLQECTLAGEGRATLAYLMARTS